MRQVHQLAQVLAKLMSLDLTQRDAVGEEWLAEAVEEVTGIDLKRLRRASPEELRSVCMRGGELSAELAVALADILMEDARLQAAGGRPDESASASERALLLYRVARDAGGALPMSVLDLL